MSRDAMEALRESRDAVAAALGSCRECLIGRADCPACHGRGRPGAFAPEPALYYTLITPAIHRMQHDTHAGNGDSATFTTLKRTPDDGD